MEWKIPIKLVSEANNREHWTKKSKRSRIARGLINLALRGVTEYPLPCRVYLTRIGPRPLDEDNLQMAFKSVRDALADLIIPGLAKGRADGDKRIQWLYSQGKGNPNEYAIKIKIEELNGM